MHSSRARCITWSASSRCHLILLASHALALCQVQPTLGSAQWSLWRVADPVHEPALCPGTHTTAGALLNSDSLGLVEQVATVIVGHTWIGTSQETQSGSDPNIGWARCHLHYAISADYCEHINLCMAVFSFREVMLNVNSPISNLINQTEMKETRIIYTVFYWQYELSESIVLLLQGSYAHTGVHLNCVPL